MSVQISRLAPALLFALLLSALSSILTPVAAQDAPVSLVNPDDPLLRLLSLVPNIPEARDGAPTLACAKTPLGNLVGDGLLDLLDVLLQAATDALDTLGGALHRFAGGHGGQRGHQSDQKRPAGCLICDTHGQLHKSRQKNTGE